MRAILFAPTDRSLYARLVAHQLNGLPGVELVGIYVRSLWSLNRIRIDLRREGPRLLDKIYDKLIVPERVALNEERPLAVLATELGLEDPTLFDFSRRTGVPCDRTRDFNGAACERSIKELAPDLIVFTGGGLIRKNTLAIPTIGVLNCHSGLLPHYRGMDTLEWAVLESGDTLPQVGLTLHLMDAGVDTGPILRLHRKQLRPGDEIPSVRRQLEPEMVRLVVEGVRDLERGRLKATPQNPEDGRQYFVIHPRLARIAAAKLNMASK